MGNDQSHRFRRLPALPSRLGLRGLFRLGGTNLLNEAKLVRDNRLEKIHYACLAREAWQNVKAACPTRPYSADYGQGFQVGFADYLYAGGNGEPPAMPPKRYRHYHAESPKGAEALQDWYEGFRHGARVAKESGLRQYVVISLPPPVAPPPPPLPPLGPNADSPTWELNLPAPPSPLSMPRRAPTRRPTAAKFPRPPSTSNRQERRGARSRRSSHDPRTHLLPRRKNPCRDR